MLRSQHPSLDFCRDARPMKRLSVWVFSWLFTATTVTWSETDRATLMGLSASVLKIEALGERGFALGSAVVVGPERVVTNCHVSAGALKINVLRGGVRWLAEPLASDIDHDLCLLRVPGLEASAVALGRADSLVPGQAVVALGYTGGVGIQLSDGEVISLHRLDGARVIQSTNWFSSGASGGGLFDADQRLVGILTFRLRGGEVHSFAAPVEWLQPLLDAPSAPAAREPPATLAYWQRPADERPWFLRAAVLERDDRWPELATLASDWAGTAAGDAEPWALLGTALARMDRPADARRAMGCARALDPRIADARERASPAGERPRAAESSAASASANSAANAAPLVALSAPCARRVPGATP
jgi:serine protease Do